MIEKEKVKEEAESDEEWFWNSALRSSNTFG